MLYQFRRTLMQDFHKMNNQFWTPFPSSTWLLYQPIYRPATLFCMVNTKFETLHDQFSSDDDFDVTKSQWNDFKYEMLQLKRKWNEHKKRMSENKFKLKQSSTEWAFQIIINNYTGEPGCEKIVQLAKVACVTPVTNAWPERGASAVKRIKSHTRSTMKNDLLNGLMHISINGP